VEQFQKGQRVVVTAEDHACAGKAGTVARAIDGGVRAWVDLDEAPPERVRAFSPEDALRSHWVKLFPEDCELERS
jgi:hypothetical protein